MRNLKNLDRGTRKSNECSNKISPNSSWKFWNPKVRNYSNFALLFSVINDNLRCYKILFWLNLIYFEQKESFEVNFSGFYVVGWKFTKFVMSYLKLKVSFSLKFGSLFNVMRDNSSVPFRLNLYMIWTKGAYQSAKFETFDCSREISPKLYFDRLLFWGHIKLQLEKYRGIISHDTEEWC